MKPKRKNKKNDIIAATIRMVARNGVKAATIRQIAAEAGVTEGALYRHFASKEELCQQVYVEIVSEMAAVKEKIVAGKDPIQDRLFEWVKITYEYFDRYPDAFTYVLLTDHDFPEDQREITTVQGRLLMKLLEQGQHTGEFVPMPLEVALSHFTGVMLNVPRLINEKILEPPAAKYTTDVAAALWRIFRFESIDEAVRSHGKRTRKGKEMERRTS